MAECTFPFYVEQKTFHSQESRWQAVPCGKCPNCLKRRLGAWAFRLEKESQLWDKQYFLTITYNPVYIPLTRNKFMTLCKKDLQDYFKRLRKNSKANFKYYAVGEYGTKRKRPHYHVILFASSFMKDDFILSCWRNPVTKEPQGDIYFGKVEPGSIAYCVQYYDKGDWYPSHAKDDRESEFSVMSKGLGKNWITKETENHLLTNVKKAFIYTKDGHKIAIPRYYKKRIYQYAGSAKILGYDEDYGDMAHASFLIHRDERLQQYEIRKKEMQEFMNSRPPAEETYELYQARAAEIINYRKSKRKMRD